MIPNLSLFVTKEKYREKKSQVKYLTNQNQQLIQELAESNRQFREVEKELKQSLDIFSTFDVTKEEAERLLRKAKNYSQKIQILEGRIKGLLWLVQQLTQQNQTKDNEINELYASEVGWEIEKTLRDKNLVELETATQNWQTSYQIAQAKLNQITEREEELLQTTHEKLTLLTSQLTNLTLSLNYIKWERDNWQAKSSQFQQQLDQQKQRAADLETENDNLRNNLANEQRSTYRSQRSQRNLRWRDSEATLFGIEEEEEQGENSNNTKSIPQIQNNSNWKSTLWQKTKKLGLTALAAYGSYQTGYHQGASNPLTDQNLAHFNNLSLNSAQLINHHHLPVSYNQTHSWIENPLSTHSNLDDQFLVFSEPDLNNQQVASLNKELISLRQNNTELANNQKPANLPDNWESELVRLKDLETRPTTEELAKAVNQERDKYKDYISPTDLEVKAQQKGMVSLETYNLRPNITLAKYQELLKNQKPLNLPKNWEFQLAQISELEKRPNISQEEFAKYKSPEQVKEIEKSVRETAQKEFKDFINPKNPKVLKEYKLFTETQLDEAIKDKAKQKDQEWKNKGLISPTNSTALSEYKLFTEGQVKKEVEKTIEDNNKIWTDKGLINPHNETDLTLANLVKKANLTAVEKERDNRPNITLPRYTELLNKEKTLATRPNITLSEWENDWSKRPSSETHANLEKERDGLKAKNNQISTDLSTAEKKVQIAEDFGLTNWDNLKDRVGNETLTTLLARPTQKELNDKQNKLDETNQKLEKSSQQVGNLTTQLNKLNSDLLSAKESSRFEIARLESESKIYQRQRDSRPDITFTDYRQLLNDKNKAALTIQGLEKSLNNTKNTANQTITDKDRQISQLQTDLTPWLDTFNNQTASAVKDAQDKLAKELKNTQTSLENWTNTFKDQKPKDINEKLSQTKSDLDKKVKTCDTLNQIKIDLELKLLTKSAKVETLNSLLDTLKNKYSQVRNEKDEVIRTREVMEKERDTAIAERDTALLNLENFNQQLDDTQQELVRTQRENRKLVKKLNQQKDQQAKTEQKFQEQSNYLWDIFNCLTSAGIGAKLGWKAGRAYERGELQIKYLKDIQNAVDILIQQKKEAQQNQQRAEQERDQLQQQIDNHRCAVNGHSPAPSQETNQTNSPAQTQTKTIHQDNTQQIVQELNATLHLNLKNPTLNQVISEIQSRIAKDPVVFAKGFNYAFDTVRKVEQELINTPFGEDLEVIKSLEIKGLNELLPNQLEEEFIQQIQQSQNYQQLVQVRNSFLAKHLAKAQKEEIKEIKPLTELKAAEIAKPFDKERYIWIGLLAISLVSIGGLLMKLRKSK